MPFRNRIARGWSWMCGLALLAAGWLYVLHPIAPDLATGHREDAFVVPDPEVVVVPPGAATTGRTFPEISSVDGAVRTSTGWIVLDARTSTLHVLVEETGDGAQPQRGLRLTGSFGGAGDGPGELRAPWRLVLAADRLVVASATGSRLDMFDGTGRWLRRLGLQIPRCPVLLRPEIAPTRGAPGLIVAGQCPSAAGMEWVVAAVDPDAPAGAPQVLVRTSAGIEEMLSFGNLRGLAAWRGRAFEGSLADGCLRAVDEALPPSLCYPSIPPVTIPDTIRVQLDRLLAGRGARLGLDVGAPREIPAVAGISWSPAGPVFEVLREGAPPARDLLLAEGRLARLPDLGDRVDPAPDRLLVSVQEMSGTRLTSIPWRGAGG